MWVNWRQGVGLADSVGRTVLGPRSVGAADANGTGMSVNIMGLLASERGSIGVGASVGLTALVERRREQRRGLGWLELRTQTALGCWRKRESIGGGKWVDRRRAVGRAGESLGQARRWDIGRVLFGDSVG